MSLKKSMKRILIIVHKYFDLDPRPQREVAALIERGYQVDVICLRRPKQNMKALEKEKLHFYALPIVRKRGSHVKYLFEYFSFFCYVSIVETWLCFRNGYNMIQVLVMPEMLVLSTILPKLLGKKILMDWEDPSREIYLTKFGEKSNSIFVPIIDLIEKLTVRAADKIITPNAGFREAFIARGHDEKKIEIVMNAPDKRIFDKAIDRESVSSNNRLSIFYSGSILPRHGLDIAIKALRIIADSIPSVRLVIVGCGEEEFTRDCLSLAKKLGVNEQIDWYGLVRIEEIPRVMQSATVVVIPNRRNYFTEINFPQRIMECGLLKIPVVVSRLPGIEHYVNETSVCFFEPENHKDLAKKIINLYISPKKLDTLAENAYQVCRKLDWERSYLEIVDDLTNGKSQ